MSISYHYVTNGQNLLDVSFTPEHDETDHIAKVHLRGYVDENQQLERAERTVSFEDGTVTRDLNIEAGKYIIFKRSLGTINAWTGKVELAEGIVGIYVGVERGNDNRRPA